jgi:hypothetical protein
MSKEADKRKENRMNDSSSRNLNKDEKTTFDNNFEDIDWSKTRLKDKTPCCSLGNHGHTLKCKLRRSL